ncbi:hypothetical protein AeMF1_014731, partial [Aphanomyces euteiches]
MAVTANSTLSITIDGQVTEIRWEDLVAQLSAAQNAAPAETLDLFWFIFGGVIVFMMMLGL